MLLLQQTISGLMLGGLYALIAVSFTLMIGVLNFLNFSIPGIFMLGGMMSWAFIKQVGLPWPAAVAIALVVCIAASLLVERATYRFMRTRFGDVTEHAIPLVSSLGFLVLFQGIMQILWGADLQYFPSPWRDPNLRLDGLVIGIPQLISLALSLILVAALTLLLKRTQLGRAIRAIAEAPDTATLLGVRVARIVPAVFVMTGVMAGLAGVLFALNYLQVSPRIGDEIAPFGMAAMVIGGLGSVWGAIAGGLLLGLIEELTIQIFGAQYLKIIVWGFLFVLLVIRPQGLFGRAVTLKGKF
jgi:branched-chain amino acid transport system permease protein